MISDKRDKGITGRGMSGKSLDAMRMEVAEREERPKGKLEELTERIEELNQFVKGGGKGEQKGRYGKGQYGGGGKAGPGGGVVKGQGKAKGKGECWTCGQEGHRSFECPTKGKGKGKGPEQLGKGGKSWGGQYGMVFSGKCFSCGATGHKWWECRKVKGGGLHLREMGEECQEDHDHDYDCGGEQHGEEYDVSNGSWPEQGDECTGNLGSMEIIEEAWEKPKPKKMVRWNRAKGQGQKTTWNFRHQVFETKVGSTVAMAADAGALCNFTLADDEAVGNLAEMMATPSPSTGNYVKVSGVVDTGADDHALTTTTAGWLKVQPSEASMAGKCFAGPGGEKIPTRGKRTIKGVTEEGQSRSLTGHVCPIRRNLFSGTKMAKAGNLVVIGDKRSYLKNLKTGEVTELRREGKAWMLDLWIKVPADFRRA